MGKVDRGFKKIEKTTIKCKALDILQNSESDLNKLIEENEKYFDKVTKLRIQDIRPAY